MKSEYLVHLNQPRLSPSLTIGAFAAFLVAAIAPRLGLILAGASYADDWGHDYAAHLASYRPISAGELWLMQSFFGPEYLTYRLPKILSALWYALSLTFLLHIARALRVPPMLFVALGVTTLLHPSFNELILWGVLSASAFAALLSVSGAAIAYLSTSFHRRLLGIVLMCAGAGGSQLASTVGACLLAVELAQRGVSMVLADTRKELAWRLAMALLPPVVALIVLAVMRYMLGYQDFGSRSFGLSAADTKTFLEDKFYVYSNAIANLYQAPVGLVFGSKIALRAFWPLVLIPLPLLAILMRFHKIPLHRTIAYGLSVPAVIVISLSPLLAATATPTGYRIIGTLLLVLTLAFSIMLAPFWSPLRCRILSALTVALVASSFAMASLNDIGVRKTTWTKDSAWLQEASAVLGALGASRVSLCSWRFPVPKVRSTEKEGIIVSYRRTDTVTYSVWYTQFLADFLRIHGIAATAPALHEAPPAECRQMCGLPSFSHLGPHALVLDPTTSTAFVCAAAP